MKLGPRGTLLIKSFEDIRLKAYKPTPKDVWTIGWGHTAGVHEGDTCTREQADSWFLQDVAVYEGPVNALPVPLTQSMFDALVSLTYNVGSGAIKPFSTIGDALRARDYTKAQKGFTLWVRQAGKRLAGLVRRREAEAALFLEDGLPEGIE